MQLHLYIICMLWYRQNITHVVRMFARMFATDFTSKYVV